MKKLLFILFVFVSCRTLSQTIFTNTIYMWGNGTGLKEMATPATPTLNYGKLFAKTDGHVYWINDGGTEFDLTSGSGGSTITTFGNGLSFSLGTLSLVTQMSITTDASGLKLVNDVTSPGNNKFYKTNSSGVRGWAGIKKVDLDDLDPNEILFGDPAGTGQVFQNNNIVVDNTNTRVGIGVTTGFVGRLNFPVGTTSADGILFGDFSVFRGFYGGDAVLAIDKGAYVTGPIYTNSGGHTVHYSKYSNTSNGPTAGFMDLGGSTGTAGILLQTGTNNVGTYALKVINDDDSKTMDLLQLWAGTDEWFDVKYTGDMKLKGIDYVLPTDNGDAGEQLQTDGSGTLTWEAAGSGGGGETNTASNLGGGLANYSTKVGVDLQFNSFAAADFDLGSNLISIDYTNGQKATTSTIGFLTDTDWDTFNNKVSFTDELAQDAVGGMVVSPLIYTDGTPSITLAGLSGLGTANQILGMDAAATGYEYKSFAFGAAGTTPNIVHTANTMTLNYPLAASTVTSGTISNTTQSISGIKTFANAMIINVAGANVLNVGTTVGTYRITNGGSNTATHTMFDVDASNSAAGAQGFGFDEGTNGFIFTAANGTRRIMRAFINLASLDNTLGSEDADLIFGTQAAGAAAAERFRITNLGGFVVNSTNTTAGTTGDQTINKPSGTVNIAGAGTTVTVTNSLVTASSLVFAVIRTADATARIANVVPGVGSFVINIVACTNEVSIGFFVIN